jgi:uncharacterized protein YndB with AHSA1/START domain
MSDRNTAKGAATVAKSEFVIKPGSNEISVTRVFDAPSDLVFKAMTDPDLIPRWWGPRRYWTKVDKMEAKSGGSWRFINGDDAGNQHGFHGVYHLVDAAGPVIIQTFEWEGLPGHVALETMRLEDLGGGKTRMVQESVFQTVEDRDGAASSGMQDGAAETHDRLAEVVAELLKDKRNR